VRFEDAGVGARGSAGDVGAGDVRLGDGSVEHGESCCGCSAAAAAAAASAASATSSAAAAGSAAAAAAGGSCSAGKGAIRGLGDWRLFGGNVRGCRRHWRERVF
jgi:hypothetical protein